MPPFVEMEQVDWDRVFSAEEEGCVRLANERAGLKTRWYSLSSSCRLGKRRRIETTDFASFRSDVSAIMDCRSWPPIETDTEFFSSVPVLPAYLEIWYNLSATYAEHRLTRR